MHEQMIKQGVQVRTLQCRAGVPTYYLAKFTGTPGSYNSCKHYICDTAKQHYNVYSSIAALLVVGRTIKVHLQADIIMYTAALQPC
jgi:hypothetical protein